MADMGEGEHEVSIEDFGYAFVPVCSCCGWLGGDHRVAGEDAKAEAGRHEHGEPNPWTAMRNDPRPIPEIPWHAKRDRRLDGSLEEAKE